VQRTEVKALEKKLLECVSKLVPEYGFSSRNKGQSFYRPIQDGGRAALHLSFTEHERGFHVSADVAVRFDAVEDLVNKDNRLLSSKEKLSTATLGAELGNISRGVPLQWAVTSHADVEVVAKQLMEAFASIGGPYLEQFEDMGRALVALSGNERASWLHSPVHYARCIRALALAVVLDRKEELSTLREKCEQFLVDKKDPGIARYRQFANSI
jgi:hypothetical protein